MSYISTGQTAKLLSVTPDAVLKWIKKGKPRARRTPGGHYRVWRDSVLELLSITQEGPYEGAERWGRPFVRCWEYDAIDGMIKLMDDTGAGEVIWKPERGCVTIL